MKFISDCLGVNDAGALTIGGVSVQYLAEKYGTPLYVMDEDQIRGNCREFMQAMKKHYPGNHSVAYAGKAFACKRMYRIMYEEGLYTDVASGGELFTALEGGMPPERIIFHGNNKTEDELRSALSAGIRRIVANGRDELLQISRIASELKVMANISLRLSPNITDNSIHKAVQTGILDSKFGIPIETGEALDAVKLSASLPGISLTGLHCHIGSPIFDLEPYLETVKTMTAFMAELETPLAELNIGGGFAVRYLSGQEAVPIPDYVSAICGEVAASAKRHGLPLPELVIEPGRAIAANAGITVYTAGSIKEVAGVRTYLSVDGGMTDNPRYMLYAAEHEITSVKRAGEAKTQRVTLAGRCCECEVLGTDMPLQTADPGDLIAVLCTGAYNYSMASNYNRIPRPPVVMVSGGEHYLAVRRETFKDIVRLDIL
jgi:diaminopimelate decarboxylase